MAAQPWKVYNKFKEYMADNTIDLDNDTFNIALVNSSYTPDLTHSRWSQVLANEVAEGNGYSSSGKALTGVKWSTGGAANVMRFTATTAGTKWSCNASSIASIRIAVIFDDSHASKKLVAYASLSSAGFSITNGNSLTITPSANGFFELT